MSTALAALGFETRVALDGKRALAIAAQLEPALVLVDIGLPGMDGYELAARLRESANVQPRLLAVTGYAELDERAAGARFDGHVVKPVDLALLEAKVRELLLG